MLIIDIVSKAFIRSKSFNIIFILNFCLAILSLTSLQFIKDSVESSLENKSKSLLGADIVVSSRFPITNEQKQDIEEKLPQIIKFSESVSTVSMVASKERSRLMEVVKVVPGFPFYGGLQFSDGSNYPGKASLKNNEVWVYQEVLNLLNLNIGDQVKIGKVKFTIKKAITSDTLNSVSFSGFMPKVYLSEEGLKNSELLQFGSTARYKLNYQLSSTFTNNQLEKVENDLEDLIDKNLRVLSPNDGRNRLIRVLSFVTNFLSLVSLISFFLGIVGLVYLYTGFLKKHKKDIDILYDLGLNKTTLLSIYLIHLMTLVLISTLIIFLFISITSPLLVPFIQEIINVDFVFSFDYSFFVKSLGVLLLLTISLGAPLIIPLINRRPLTYIYRLTSYLPFISILLFISHQVTSAKNIGLYFSIAILIIILVCFLIGHFTLRKLNFSGHFNNLSLSLAFKRIIRNKETTLTLFTAIILCTALFSIIPQIGASLSTALNLSVKDKPRFFIIDAKEEQIKDLKTFVNAKGASLDNISPMIRGRIVQVNDIDFREHTDKNSKEELKNRSVNLSYRDSIKATEKIIEGREFSGKYISSDFLTPVEISVEERYAKRRGLKLHDKLVFDILGLEVNAIVTNIRSVKWTEFVPNFFLIFQSGVLEDAPKTVLATISSGDYDAQKMMLDLSDDFPALTIIDVKNIFEQFSKLVKNVTSITDKMSLYSIVIGLLMSFIIIQYQMGLQKNNILRLKMIGVKGYIIKRSYLIQFAVITFGASLLGVIFGSISSFYLSDLLFESYWESRPAILIAYVFLIPTITVLVVSYLTNRNMKQQENSIFGE